MDDCGIRKVLGACEDGASSEKMKFWKKFDLEFGDKRTDELSRLFKERYENPEKNLNPYKFCKNFKETSVLMFTELLKKWSEEAADCFGFEFVFCADVCSDRVVRMQFRLRFLTFPHHFRIVLFVHDPAMLSSLWVR